MERRTDYYVLPITGTENELGWLGYYIGQNTTLQKISLHTNITDESFYNEIRHNKSIHEILFERIGIIPPSEAKPFRLLTALLTNGSNLVNIYLKFCDLAIEDVRQLSSAIRNCNKSIKRIEIINCVIWGNCADIIAALSMHPQLEDLDVSGMRIGRNGCTALSTLLRCTTTQLKYLNLYDNFIDDEGVQLLVNALANNNTLQELCLASTGSSDSFTVTDTGWKTLSTLLEMPVSNLQILQIYCNRELGNEGALVFANALVNNSTLEQLDLDDCGITPEGWAPFSKLLCDTSSVNDTYLSNHTLQYLGDEHDLDSEDEHYEDSNICPYLQLNKREDKQQTATIKILGHYSHFDMEPFFEWELKVLPLMMKWFEMAHIRTTAEYQYAQYTQGGREDLDNLRLKINKMQLSVVYDFIREFPMLYIEPITRKEIADYTALEQGGDEQEVRLEEIWRCKARAMRRLA